MRATSNSTSCAGLQDFFQQNYEDAQSHFDKVLRSDPYHVPARSLKAVAVHHHGDEFGYFDEIRKINLSDASTFEDKFFSRVSRIHGVIRFWQSRYSAERTERSPITCTSTCCEGLRDEIWRHSWM